MDCKSAHELLERAKSRVRSRFRTISVLLASCVLLTVLSKLVFDWRLHRYDASIPPALSVLTINEDQEVPIPLECLLAIAHSGDFQVGHEVRQIPAAVQKAFARIAGRGAFEMAEPGAAFSSACIRVGGLPSRRLLSVATSTSYCFVFYERGGFEIADNVAVFRILCDDPEPIWHAFGPEMKNLDTLTSAARHGHQLRGDKSSF